MQMRRQKSCVCTTWFHSCTKSKAMNGVQESPLKKGRVRPENFVCQTVEELIEWMDARQSDMHVAVETGNAPEVGELAAMLGGSVTVEESTVVHRRPWCVRPHFPEVDIGSIDEGGGFPDIMPFVK